MIPCGAASMHDRFGAGFFKRLHHPVKYFIYLIKKLKSKNKMKFFTLVNSKVFPLTKYFLVFVYMCNN